MTAETITAALGGHRSGAGWMAKCPAHDDRNPSLSIRNNSGTLLVHCHAGCRQEAVITALRTLGLWQLEDFTRRRVVNTYGYTDERRTLLYEVVRYEPKAFKQRRPDGRGDWIWKKGERQVLYRLPEVIKAPIVFVVEGEKDVETLREHGFVATTNAGGADAQWLPSYTQNLVGREVILVPDADEPGRLRVLKIARALIGHAAQITIFEPDAAKDITDWFDDGHSDVELIERVDRKLVSL